MHASIAAASHGWRYICRLAFITAFITGCYPLYAQVKPIHLSYTVSVKNPADHFYHVIFECEGIKRREIEYKLPAWTPGYYQLMNYAGNIRQFNASTVSGKSLEWRKSSANGWTVAADGEEKIILSYDVQAVTPFVAANYLDAERGYITPAGLFLYPEGFLKQRLMVTVLPDAGWNRVATGLDATGAPFTFAAPDYDVLYDSPFLMGKLDSLPSFTVRGKPHYFMAFRPGDFDRDRFMQDLQKIVIAGSGIIGEIPYSHYSFLAIGPGGGGIEHLNSASIAFNANGMNTREGMIRMYNFLAHEYFHLYNVKRIRPVELGPFDYDQGSKTKMLWLSEGITVYYEYLILKRAGITSRDELLQAFQRSIREYEEKPGRQFQTPAEASYDTWSDGPFGRTGDEVNKTISPYDKGPALGLLLDFKIRHETKNKQSLDALMRLLYIKYYKKLGRGFTENEFRDECEKLAGTDLQDFFDYIYTLKPVDYPAYLRYAGLSIDTVNRIMPGAWLGITVKDRNDSLVIAAAEWQSPAWRAGLRKGTFIAAINGQKMNAASFQQLLDSSNARDTWKLRLYTQDGEVEKEIQLSIKKERSYEIRSLAHPDRLQSAILQSWFGGR